MLSIIVPTYNSARKMGRTIQSLRDLREELPDHEVVFVDDCSQDDTPKLLSGLVEKYPNWRLLSTEVNSGTAAAPRNIGIDAAKGDYLFFLDGDDSLEIPAFVAAYEFAARYDADIVRTTLLVENAEGSLTLGNRIPGWRADLSTLDRVKLMVRHQSLTSSAFVRRTLLTAKGIRFPEDLRIGEDVTFSCRVLANANRIYHRDAPAFRYIRHVDAGDSVTQSLSSSDFVDFFKAWVQAEAALRPTTVSFLLEHGSAAIEYALKQYIWTAPESLTPSDFALFTEFCRDHWAIVGKYSLPPRLQELLLAAYGGNYEEFCRLKRLRVLVAGHDLKFMDDILRRLELDYTVLIDQWEGHKEHSEAQSRELLAQADIVWVEWLLGASVWYSKNLWGHQRLIVRTHRSEVTADYGLAINARAVSKFIAVAPQTLSDFSDRFDIPREKFVCVPNGFSVSEYTRYPVSSERLYRLAMVGISPRLKGYLNALKLLATLRQTDTRYTLDVFGKKPEEYAWLMRDDEERKYYEECAAFAEEAELEDCVNFRGWADLKPELGKYYATLSMSDIEGMQVAPGEAMCAASLGLLLDWRGSDGSYPAEFIFSDVQSLASFILELRAPRDYERAAEVGRTFIEEHYDWSIVWPRIKSLLDEVQNT